MVKRLQEMRRPVIVTDLDGTLLRGNSMRIFMRWLPGRLRRNRKYLEAVRTLWWLGLRSLRVVSHKTMKWHLTKIARTSLANSDWQAIAEKIAESVNPDVRQFIESRRKEVQASVVIASAAMEEYVKPLCNVLGYDEVIATDFNRSTSEYVETRGKEKLAAIRSLLERENLILDTFLTDHYDDCPTAEAFPDRTIIVNPTEEHEALFREAGVTRFYRESQRDGSFR